MYVQRSACNRMKFAIGEPQLFSIPGFRFIRAFFLWETCDPAKLSTRLKYKLWFSLTTSDNAAIEFIVIQLFNIKNVRPYNLINFQK